MQAARAWGPPPSCGRVASRCLRGASGTPSHTMRARSCRACPIVRSGRTDRWRRHLPYRACRWRTAMASGATPPARRTARARMRNDFPVVSSGHPPPDAKRNARSLRETLAASIDVVNPTLRARPSLGGTVLRGGRSACEPAFGRQTRRPTRHHCRVLDLPGWRLLANRTSKLGSAGAEDRFDEIARGPGEAVVANRGGKT